MATIVDQPPPIATDRRPVWDSVISLVESRRSTFGAYGKTGGAVDLTIADMRDRDQLGRERYGVPLTSGNGRDHLIDAAQEALDLLVYLAAELDEHGVDLTEPVDTTRQGGWYLFNVQSMLWDHTRTVIRLRALIEERVS